MRASGILNSRPKHGPTAQPGQGKRAAPITNPIPKRAMKAAVIAAFLSGKLIGSMIPMSMAPNTKPQMTPSRTLDICVLPFKLLANLPCLVNQLIRPVSRCDLKILTRNLCFLAEADLALSFRFAFTALKTSVTSDRRANNENEKLAQRDGGRNIRRRLRPR